MSVAHRLGEPGIQVVCPVAIEPTRDRQLHAPVDGVTRHLHEVVPFARRYFPMTSAACSTMARGDDQADVPRGVQIHDDPSAGHGLKGD